jgi:rhodanese-related sulfurtransferase
MSTATMIDAETTMEELLRAYPGAQRALFRAFHIGGCASCGFAPDETLAEVCARNNDLPVREAVATILAGHEEDSRMQISPAELAARLEGKESPALIDVRSREEWDAVHLEGSSFFTQELMQEILSEWPKDREIVFICHHGFRSLDAAAYFLGHGFRNARSLSGGIDAWSSEIDPALPRYQLE